MISQVSFFPDQGAVSFNPSKRGCSDTPEVLTAPADRGPWEGSCWCHEPHPCWEDNGKGSVLLRDAALLSGNLPIPEASPGGMAWPGTGELVEDGV